MLTFFVAPFLIRVQNQYQLSTYTTVSSVSVLLHILSILSMLSAGYGTMMFLAFVRRWNLAWYVVLPISMQMPPNLKSRTPSQYGTLSSSKLAIREILEKEVKHGE